jgi:outer membrane protein OmpA-like peptidoglycan-associated protein
MLPVIVTASAWAQTPEASSANLTGRSITAIGYQVGRGSTNVDLKATGLLAQVSGEAKVEAKPGATQVEAKAEGLTPPMQLGSEFLTYVLWAVSPEGRAMNLGEILTDSEGRGKLKVTTPFQTFSLFATAEPYAAVRQPSEMLVLENQIRKNTKGKIFVVSNYQLMKRSQYEKLGNPLALSLDLKNVPLEMYEARNAVEIARSRGADRYAPDIFSKAENGLKMAEHALARNVHRKEIISLARQTSQFSEDSRVLTVERQEAERIAADRSAAAAKARAEAEAKAAAEAAEASRKADEEAKRQAELAAAREAQMKAEAAAKQAQMRAESEIAAAKAKAEADALRAREEAAKGEADRALRASEELRAQLLDQFNRILETRDTVRGLVITMGDVLFDTGKYDLRMNARELLAKISGIVLAHPGLNLEVEGYTDSTGSDELNQRLSEQRAGSVRDYLIGQGLFGEAITARGFGKNVPVASNDTSAGRQKNRRVELIVSGEVIGVKIGK